jgi:hypothetical protein
MVITTLTTLVMMAMMKGFEKLELVKKVVP